MNGALTIGTLDGVNVEMREQMGEENFFLFGLSAPEAEELRTKGYRIHNEIIDFINNISIMIVSNQNKYINKNNSSNHYISY